MDRAGSEQVHDAPESPESELVGGPIQEHPGLVARANPITYVRRGVPPFLIMHGDRDPLVPFNQSELLDAALRRVGADVRFVRLAGAGHGTAEFHSPESLALVYDFFDRTIGRI
jgi:dipeptidyl aminopeptidase/acylaminoacyl peptidase